jgi:hypothetical protein
MLTEQQQQNDQSLTPVSTSRLNLQPDLDGKAGPRALQEADSGNL